MSDAKISIAPLAGIDNASRRDDALLSGGDARRVYLREARDVSITMGRASLRPGMRKVSSFALRNIWQSPLHGDVFAAMGEDWVRVNAHDWSHEVLAAVGPGSISHLVLNGKVLAASQHGIWQFDGATAWRLAIDRPPAALALVVSGALAKGSYGVAVSWLRGSLESPLSQVTHCAVDTDGGLQITLPLCMDASVTTVRLYLTRADGGELLRAEDFPVGTHQASIMLLPALGAPAPFHGTDPMPGGQLMSLWGGRLVVARGDVLRFSEPMAYHVHNPVHGFVQLPQRVTFVVAVDGGLWVGQVDHVVFLRGTSPAELTLERKTSRPPVPGSALLLAAEVAGEASGGGRAVCAWLAGNGYVLGLPDGGVIETSAGRLENITGQQGFSVVWGKRLVTAVV